MKVDNKEIPIHKVVRFTTKDMGLYRGYATSIVIDAPFETILEKKVGLQFDEGSPLCLSFDGATLTEIDGKIYLVLIRERFEKIEEKENDG